MDGRTLRMQLGAVERDNTEFLAEIVIRATLDARNMWWMGNEAPETVWMQATEDVFADIVPFWPDRIDKLQAVVQHLEDTDPDGWSAMRRGVSKYIRKQEIGSLTGKEGWLRQWARDVKYADLPSGQN